MMWDQGRLVLLSCFESIPNNASLSISQDVWSLLGSCFSDISCLQSTAIVCVCVYTLCVEKGKAQNMQQDQTNQRSLSFQLRAFPFEVNESHSWPG